MRYCRFKPWDRVKADTQVVIWAIGWVLFMLYVVATLIVGSAAWVDFFGGGMFPERPMWVEFIRLSWYFWVPTIMLRLLHMLVCEKN